MKWKEIKGKEREGREGKKYQGRERQERSLATITPGQKWWHIIFQTVVKNPRVMTKKKRKNEKTNTDFDHGCSTVLIASYRVPNVPLIENIAKLGRGKFLIVLTQGENILEWEKLGESTDHGRDIWRRETGRCNPFHYGSADRFLQAVFLCLAVDTRHSLRGVFLFIFISFFFFFT